MIITFNNILLIFTAIAHAFIGIYVLYKSHKEFQNIVFSLFALGLSGWVTCVVFMRVATNPLFWTNIGPVPKGQSLYFSVVKGQDQNKKKQ